MGMLLQNMQKIPVLYSNCNRLQVKNLHGLLIRRTRPGQITPPKDSHQHQKRQLTSLLRPTIHFSGDATAANQKHAASLGNTAHAQDSSRYHEPNAQTRLPTTYRTSSLPPQTNITSNTTQTLTPAQTKSTPPLKHGKTHLLPI